MFLGNTGALPLGGLLGFLAVVARQELLLVVIAGVFVVEAMSVIVQVGYYKWRAPPLVAMRPAAPPFPVSRLGRKQNRRSFLDCRSVVCLAWARPR